MSRYHSYLDPEAQRSVLRGDCYYCWLGQFDKCEANCNNKRAVPRYGNHDITPSGKFQLRSVVGSESHSEWLINQESKRVMANGQQNDDEGFQYRDRSASIGVGGQAGRLSRFEILQENKKAWALRHPLLSVPPPKLASLASGGDGTNSAGRGLDKASYFGSEGGGGSNGLIRARTPPPSSSRSKSKGGNSVANTSADGDTEHSTRPAHLQIRSCRLPIQPDIPHRHAAGAVKVQVTPYSFAEIAQRSSLLAAERRRTGRSATPSASVVGGGRGVSVNASRSRDPSPSVNAYSSSASVAAYGGGATVAGMRASSPSISVVQRGSSVATNATTTARERSNINAIEIMQRGRGGVVMATKGGGPNSRLGGPTIKVVADDTSSYILSARVQSVKDMPLPPLFAMLDD